MQVDAVSERFIVSFYGVLAEKDVQEKVSGTIPDIRAGWLLG